MSSFTLAAASAESFGTSYIEAVEPRTSCIEAFLVDHADRPALDMVVSGELFYARLLLGLMQCKEGTLLWNVPWTLDSLWDAMFDGSSANEMTAYIARFATAEDLNLLCMTKNRTLQLAVATHPLLTDKSASGVMCNTKSLDVRKAVISNRALTAATIASIWHLAVSGNYAEDVAVTVASNPNTPWSLVEHIFDAYEAVDSSFAAALRNNVVQLRRVAAQLARFENELQRRTA